MDVGVIVLPTPNPGDMVALAHRAADLGFAHLGVGDIPGPDGELYVALGLLVGSAVKARVGPMVTNPASRHPTVTSAAIDAIARANPGGAFLGLGRGGSPLVDVGLPRPSTTELSDGIVAIRRALDRIRSSVPIHLSAYGPRTLRLAGQLADGVTIAGGSSPAYLQRAIRTVRDAAQAAGRNPGSVEISVLARVAIGATRAEAIRGIRGNLASAGANNLRAESDLADLSDDMRARLEELRHRYDASPQAHVSAGSSNADLIDELGLTDMLADRYALAGSEQEVAGRLREYHTLGVSTVWIPVVEAEPEALLDRLAAALTSGCDG